MNITVETAPVYLGSLLFTIFIIGLFLTILEVASVKWKALDYLMTLDNLKGLRVWWCLEVAFSTAILIPACFIPSAWVCMAAALILAFSIWRITTTTQQINTMKV